MKKPIVLGVVLFVFCAAAPALADDLNPPPYRGAPLSYRAEWDAFGHFGNVAGFLPDTESSVDDTNPATNLYTGFGTHLDLEPVGVWSITAQGGLTNTVPATFVANTINWVDWLPEKWLRVQVAYTGAVSPSIISVTGITEAAPLGSGLPGSEDLLTPVSLLGGFSDGSSYFYEDYILLPNPDWEAIVFNLPLGTVVEQIVIDTVSLPEPTSMGLMLIALIGVIGWARKRRV